jgi:hypothetical protein
VHGGPTPEDDTCPGYLIALPAVQEGLTAQPWLDKGQLAEYLDGQAASPHLRGYVDTVTGAVGELQVERMAEQHRELEAKRRT